MHATKAAVEEGIVPGGGVALLRGAKALEGLKLEGDQKVGMEIVRRAIEEPMRHIATNAGAEGSIVVAKVKEMKQDEGFNAATEVYEDLVKAGVIDPAKVVRNALQNASSIASLLLTTEALVSEIPEEKKDAPSMPQAAAAAWAGWTKIEASKLRRLRSRAGPLLAEGGRRGRPFFYFRLNATVTVITIGTGWPLSSVGVNFHWRTASTAACSSSGGERSTRTFCTLPSSAITASRITTPPMREASAMGG